MCDSYVCRTSPLSDSKRTRQEQSSSFVSATFSPLPPAHSAMKSITLLDKKPITETLYSLTFSRPEGWDWRAGQFARLGLDLGGKEAVFRAYSLSSAPHDKVLSFLIKCVEGGTLSPKLCALPKGSDVLLDGEAQGNLLPERIPGGDTLWFFATGAGLAPFLALLKSPEDIAPWSRIELVLSARTLSEAEGLKAEALATAHPRLKVTAATTREPSALVGRIPALIESGTLEALTAEPLNAERSRVLLCGNPDFIRDMRALLKTRGLVSPRFGKPGQLLVESLW